jgi:tetratricopeptide (TPR) repeat protein
MNSSAKKSRAHIRNGMRGISKAAFVSILIITVFAVTMARAFDKKTTNALSYYIVASIYERLGELDKAIVQYRQALRFDYTNPAIHLGLGSAYLKKDNTAQAIEELNLAVKFNPDAVEPHAILALLYFSQSKLSEAGKEYESALQKAVVLEPQNSVIYKSLGFVYLQKRDFVSAEHAYKTVASLNPADAEAHFYLATIYDERKEFAAVEQELKTAIQLKEDYAEALNYLGYWYTERNENLAQAHELLKKAVSLDPENGAYLDSLGWLYFKQGKFAQSIELLEKAAVKLEDSVIYHHLGDAYVKARNSQKAKEFFLKALTIEPGNEEIKKKMDALK